MPRAVDLVDALQNGSMPEPNSGCWLWIGATTPGGYGKLRNKGRTIIASRASWMAHRGAIPEGLCVLHKCDTPACVNPDHLFLGTIAENVEDMVRKGRHRVPEYRHYAFGSRLPQTKLSDAAVLEIRASTSPLAVLASRYGVSQSLISLVRRGKTRTRVQPERQP